MFRPKTVHVAQQIVVFSVLLIVTLAGGNVSIVALNARVLLVVLLLLATGVSLFSSVRGASLATPLDGGWLLLTAATLLAVLSFDVRRCIEAWLFPFGLQLPYFYAVVALLRAHWDERRWLRALLMVSAVLFIQAGILTLAYALTWRAFQPPGLPIFPMTFRLFGVLDNPNVFGAFLALTIPAALGYFLRTRSLFQRVLIGVWLAAALICLVATGSRLGLLATSAGVGSVLALSFFSAQGRVQRLRIGFAAHRLQFGGLLLIALLVAAFSVGAVVSLLLAESSAPSRIYSVARRFDLWQVALTTAVQHPILGVGIGNYPVELMKQRSTPPTLIERHAHNGYLTWLAENGLIGLGVLLIFIGLLIRAGWLAWRRANIERRLLLSGIIGGLIAFGISNLVDDPLLQGAPLFCATTFCALLAAAARSPDPAVRTRSERLRLNTAIGAASLAISGVGLLLVGAYLMQWQGAQRVATGEGAERSWYASALILDRSAVLDTADPLIHLQAAIAWAHFAYTDGSTDALDRAVQRYRTAIKLDPTYAVHHLNLAMLLKRQQQPEAALQELAIAAQQAPDSAVIRLNYGAALEAAGQEAAACAEYRQTLLLNEQWRGALFWQATPLRQQVLDSLPPGKSAPSVVNDEARRLLARGLLAMNSGDYRLARYYLKGIVELGVAEPDAVPALLYLGDLNAAEGKLDAARRDYLTAFGRVANYGAFGPGTLGEITYSVNVFGRYGYISDYLPDVLLLDITPVEAVRFIKVAQFDLDSGQLQQALYICHRILLANPGFPLPIGCLI